MSERIRSGKMVNIGTVKLTVPKTFRKTYETASWWQDVVVEAGAEAELRTDGNFVFCKFDGVKGGSYFIARIGAHYGTPDRDRGMGDPDSYCVQMYDYMAADAIAHGTFLNGAEVTLNPGIGIGSRETTLKRWIDGEYQDAPHTAYFFTQE